MSDATTHEIMDVPLDEDAIPKEEVPLETIRSGLQSDSNMVRHQAATVAAGSANKDPGRIAELFPLLRDGLEDDQNIVIYQSTTAMSLLAEHDPEIVEPAIGRLVELLEHDLPIVQSIAARALGLVALDNPAQFDDHTETLVNVVAEEPTDRADIEGIPQDEISPEQRQSLRSMNREELKRQQLARDITANLLVEVAEHDPDALLAHADTFVALLEEDNPSLVTVVAEIVGILAQTDPEPVAGAVDPLVDLLDHEDETVVANAVTALGFLEDPASVEPLESVADDEDRDPDLRDLAGKTAEFIDD